MANKDTAVISLAHWEENIFYSHTKWMLVAQKGTEVLIKRISAL